MAILTVAELKLVRDRLRVITEKLDAANNEALDDGTITLGQHSRIFNLIQMLRNALAELIIELFRAKIASITVPDDSPGAKIEASIDNLEAATNNLNDVRNVLNAVATVINVVNDIIGALLSVAALI